MQVIEQTRRLIRLVSWLQPLPRVVKLIVDGCFRGNSGLSVISGVLHDHRGVIIMAFGSFLRH